MQIKVITSEAPKGETNKRCPDITKLKKLGFNPQIKLDTGLKKTVDWYFENKHLKC